MSSSTNRKVCYIFEDNKDVVLSKFISESFVKDINTEFVFAEGNCNLQQESERYLDKDYHVYTFLDTVPGNASITKIYYDLLKIQKSNKNFVMIPIVCAEYYLLCSLQPWQFGGDLNILHSCISQDMYLDLEVAKRAKEAQDMPSHKTFEKVCKSVIGRYGNWCLRFTKGSDSKSNKAINASIKKFYEEDCLCTVHRDSCTTVCLQDKIKALVEAYPTFPSKTKFTNHKQQLTRTQLLSICDKLVSDYNKLSMKLREAAPEGDRHFYEDLVLPTVYCLTHNSL